ncbi:hypothetical protein BS50DRAFT_592469 [Corynespora cassiicola Philippines]|uniref:Uncharacterized protein n=1 Tax=Corynespora cassiicola Philippines TaxID=1448308 RepID=A0A2T2NB49_CORCC|nr:hypothetical protein BS50DRAFT_592469 [Corynespora cassiicola Philippines]
MSSGNAERNSPPGNQRSRGGSIDRNVSEPSGTRPGAAHNPSASPTSFAPARYSTHSPSIVHRMEQLRAGQQGQPSTPHTPSRPPGRLREESRTPFQEHVPAAPFLHQPTPRSTEKIRTRFPLSSDYAGEEPDHIVQRGESPTQNDIMTLMLQRSELPQGRVDESDSKFSDNETTSPPASSIDSVRGPDHTDGNGQTLPATAQDSIHSPSIERTLTKSALAHNPRLLPLATHPFEYAMKPYLDENALSLSYLPYPSPTASSEHLDLPSPPPPGTPSKASVSSSHLFDLHLEDEIPSYLRADFVSRTLILRLGMLLLRCCILEHNVLALSHAPWRIDDSIPKNSPYFQYSKIWKTARAARAVAEDLDSEKLKARCWYWEGLGNAGQGDWEAAHTAFGMAWRCNANGGLLPSEERDVEDRMKKSRAKWHAEMNGRDREELEQGDHGRPGKEDEWDNLLSGFSREEKDFILFGERRPSHRNSRDGTRSW